MNRWTWALLAVVFAVGALLRFTRLDEFPPGLHPDEATNGNNAVEASRTGDYKVFYPENHGREGLFINLEAVALRLAGRHEPWVLRSTSALIGTLTVLGTFFCLFQLARLSDEPSPAAFALVGAYLIATSFWHLVFSRIAFRAILAPGVLVLAIGLAASALRTRRVVQAVAAGAMLGLGFHTYLAFRIMPLLFLAFVLLVRRPGGRRLIVGFLAGAAAVAAPLALHFLLHPADFLGRASTLSVFSEPSPLALITKNIAVSAGMFHFRGDNDWVHNIRGRPQLFWPVGVAFAIGVVLALRRRSLLDRVLLLWIVLASIPVVLSSSALPHALRSLTMVPAVMGLAAVGFLSAGRAARARLPAFPVMAVGAGLAVALAAEASVSYFQVWGRNEETVYAMASDYVAISRAINALPREADKYVVVRVGGDDVRGLPWPTQSVQFLTDSFLEDSRAARHIHYLTPAAYEVLRARIPPDAHVFVLDP